MVFNKGLIHLGSEVSKYITKEMVAIFNINVMFGAISTLITPKDNPYIRIVTILSGFIVTILISWQYLDVCHDFVSESHLTNLLRWLLDRYVVLCCISLLHHNINTTCVSILTHNVLVSVRNPLYMLFIINPINLVQMR